jgi:hypothetical protein
MRNLLLAAIAALVPALSAQDFIHYKFDANCTNEVINYATGPQALASNGTLQTNSVISPFGAGLFGGCLAGGANLAPTYYNRVITGWNPGTQPIVGSLTMAWFMKLRSGASVGTTLCYMMGAPSGGFRLFTNGVAGTGLYQREIVPSGGNPGRDFVLPAATVNVQALAAAGWTHIAMVFDSTAQTANWYVNGISVLQLTGVPGASITLAGPFQIGYYSSPSAYDIDEFFMSLRALTAAEVLVLSLTPRAGDGDYTSGIASQCGAGNVVVASSGGPPTIGNLGYALTVTATTPSIYLLLAGFDRCLYGGVIPLPLDGTPILPLLNGCWILADAPILLNGVSLGVPDTIPIPIAATVGPGTVIYTQALGLDMTTFASSMSNGFATSIGN